MNTVLPNLDDEAADLIHILLVLSTQLKHDKKWTDDNNDYDNNSNGMTHNPLASGSMMRGRYWDLIA